MKMTQKFRLLIVDDSPVIIRLLRSIFSAASDIEVVGQKVKAFARPTGLHKAGGIDKKRHPFDVKEIFGTKSQAGRKGMIPRNNVESVLKIIAIARLIKIRAERPVGIAKGL